MRADSPEGLQSNLAALCGPLVLNLPEQEAKETALQVAAALRWLQQHPGWFLIFDNVDSDEAAKSVEDLLGRLSPHGQVLITSRLSKWQGMVRPLELDVLSVDASAAYLLAATDGTRKPTSSDADDAGALAELLGQLPLALTQAAAFINEQGISLERYIEIWNQSRPKVLAWFDERQMQYPASVAITWETSFRKLPDRAKALLRILAWFAPDPIPESLLDIGLEASNELAAISVHELRDGMITLKSYSLLTRDLSVSTFAVHRLVQEVTRQGMPQPQQRMALVAAIAWLNAGMQGDSQDVRTWPVLEPLAPHAEAAAGYAEVRSIHDGVGQLLSYCATLDQGRARYSLAEPLYRRTLAIEEARYGPNHPSVATCLNNLAALLSQTNRLEEAEPLYRRALAIGEVSYGQDHPDVAIAMNNLAGLLQDTNRLEEAESLYRRALAVGEASLGPDHPNVAIRLTNLALLLRATNRLAEAEPLVRRALAISEASFGPDHPSVAIDLNNLASLRYYTNRFAEAEPLFRRALVIDEVSFGPDHPSVARDLNNLASLLQHTNRLAEAEPLYRRALAIDETSFGPDHPTVARDLHNLAGLLHVTNRLSEAEPLLRRSLSILVGFTRGTGHQHPRLQVTIKNYVYLLTEMGKSKEEVLDALRDIAPDLFG